MVERPEIVTDDHLEFLDDLWESGITNMFSAHPYLQDEFPKLSEKEAKTILIYWMKSCGQRHGN